MPRIIGLQQNTPEWIVHRHGMVTASRVADVMSYLKGGKESAKRRDYRSDLICEILTGKAIEHYVTPAMEAGLENEPLAVAAYEMQYDCEAEEGGFWVHDRIGRFGASPDRLIGEDGLIEAKCPTTGTHLDYVLAGVVPDDYKPQMLAQMSCTGRKWCDFISFDPKLPPKMRLFVRRFQRDDEAIARMEAEVEKLLDEIAATLQRLAQTDPSELTEVLQQSLTTP